MKKALALFLILASLAMTACGEVSDETSTDTQQTERTSHTETTATETTSQTQKTETTSADITETTADTQQTEDSGVIPEKPEFRPEGIVLADYRNFFQTPAGITFSRHKEYDSDRCAYYDPETKKAYIYCFDPLCTHEMGSGCYSSGFGNRMSVYSEYDERFYTAAFHTFCSYSKYGADEQNISRAGIPEDASFWDVTAYGKYLYITAKLADYTETHIIRYDIDSGELVDLTEKSGVDFTPLYFYDGYIYGGLHTTTEDGVLLTTTGRVDLDFEGFESCKRLTGNICFAEGNALVCVETEGEHAGEIKLYYPEEDGICYIPVGRKVESVIAADEEHFYFLANEPYQHLDAIGNVAFNNITGGKIYRVKRDGTERVCMYENPNMDFYYSDIAYVSGNTMLVRMEKYDPTTYRSDDGQIYSGYIGPNGKIEAFKKLTFEDTPFVPVG